MTETCGSRSNSKCSRFICRLGASLSLQRVGQDTTGCRAGSGQQWCGFGVAPFFPLWLTKMGASLICHSHQKLWSNPDRLLSPPSLPLLVLSPWITWSSAVAPCSGSRGALPADPQPSDIPLPGAPRGLVVQVRTRLTVDCDCPQFTFNLVDGRGP